MAKDKDIQEETKEDNNDKSGGNKLLLVVIIILLLMLLIIGGAVAYFLLSSNENEPSSDMQKIEKKQKTKEATEIGPIYPLDPFTVNLLSNGGSRYLKCKIDLELDSPELQQEIDKKVAPIRDAIIEILSSKTVEELLTSKGKEKVKEEIKRRLNSMLSTGEIKNVYFTEFVIQ